MGWSYRKSFRAGPFRVNVSKTGVGYSVGGKGFRTGVNSQGRQYRSISIPGTGLRHYASGKKAATGCLLLVATCVSIIGGVTSFGVLFQVTK